MNLSVIVPVYNHASFLKTAIGSILEENLDNIEIIVIDDGSADGSIKTVQGLPIRIVRLNENHGVAFSRNLGIRLSTGDYITFFDSDNILCKGSLRNRLFWLEENPNDFAVAGITETYIDTDGNIKKIQKKYPEYLSLDYFKNGHKFQCSVWAFIFRKEVFRKYTFDESLHYADDCDFILKLLKDGPIKILDVPVLTFRFHNSNISARLINGSLNVSRKVIAETALVFMSYGISFKPDFFDVAQ